MSQDQPIFRTCGALGALLLLALAGGCSGPGVIFPPVNPPVVFPPAPEVTRISYVGQLAADTDLKPAKDFFKAMGEAIFGKHDVHAMLSPYALCTDNKSRVFVTDSNAQVVHVFDLDSRKYATWQPAEKQKFSQPVGIAWDPAGRLLVADSVGGCVFVFDAAGKLLAEWGQGRFNRPCGIAVDAKSNRIVVADATAHQVVVLSTQGEVTARVGQRGTALGEFNYPTNIAVDSGGRIYVSDSLNFRVQQFSPDLKPVRQIGSKGDLPGYFSQPKGIAVDSEDHLYAIDAQFEAVQIFDTNGTLLLSFGEEGQKPGEFWLPAGIFIDAQNRIWIADCYNRRIQAFDYHPETKP